MFFRSDLRQFYHRADGGNALMKRIDRLRHNTCKSSYFRPNLEESFIRGPKHLMYYVSMWFKGQSGNIPRCSALWRRRGILVTHRNKYCNHVLTKSFVVERLKRQYCPFVGITKKRNPCSFSYKRSFVLTGKLEKVKSTKKHAESRQWGC